MLKQLLKNQIIILAMLIISGLGVSKAYAGELMVSLIDQNGENIENSVIMLYPNQGQEINFTSPYPQVMAQRDMTFVPHVLPVFIGSEVNFPNQDETRHHVYSFSQARVLELRLYEGGAERTVDFPNQGAVVLGCNIHDSMLGYIYVSDTPIFLKSDRQGKAHFNDLPAGEYKMRFWHPRLRNSMEDSEQLITINAEGTQTTSHELQLKRQRRSRGVY